MESTKLEISKIVVVQSIDLFKRTKFKIKCIFFQKIDLLLDWKYQLRNSKNFLEYLRILVDSYLTGVSSTKWLPNIVSSFRNKDFVPRARGLRGFGVPHSWAHLVRGTHFWAWHFERHMEISQCLSRDTARKVKGKSRWMKSSSSFHSAANS